MNKADSTSITCWIAVMWIAISLTPHAYPQNTGTASLRGKVRDQNGALIQSAKVTLINVGTNEQRQIETSKDGVYVFASISPGVYSLEVECSGFKSFLENGLKTSPAETRGFDVTLQAGPPEETVTVTRDENQLETETGAKQHTLKSKQIDDLSIISRSALELMRVLPGVSAPDNTELQTISFISGVNRINSYNVNGTRGENNNLSIDGSRVIDFGSNGTVMITPNNEMVQEVTVQTSNYAAEFGSSAVQITATTKSGTNLFHGALYDYVRNWNLNATDRSRTIFRIERPRDKYQFPGGNIGGPICLPRFGEGAAFGKCYRNKLFFFFAVEIQRQDVDEGAVFDRVPTQAERQGHFIIGGKPVDLRSQIDPTGKVFLNFYPLTNFHDTSGINRNANYTFSGLHPINRDQQALRVDYNINDKTRLYVRLMREGENQNFARGLWGATSAYELPSHIFGNNLSRSIALNMASLISPTMTNEVLFTSTALYLNSDYEDPAKVSLTSLGLTHYEGPFGQQSKYAPMTFFTSPETTGDLFSVGGEPVFAHNSSSAVIDNLTKVANVHTLKFGGVIERGDKTQKSPGVPEGGFIFAPWGANSTGDVFGDILVGRPALVIQSTQLPTGSFRFYNYEGYAQDSWKVRSSITLEYGIRVASFPNNYERNNLGVLFDPASYDHSQGVLINDDSQHPNGFLLAKRNEIPKGMTRSPHLQFMPRLGFAWDIGGKSNTVLRGGAGVFNNRVQGNYQYFVTGQPPNAYNVNLNSFDFLDLANGTGLTFQTMHLIDPYQQLGAVGVSSLNPDSIFVPRTTAMSLSLARRLPLNNILEVSYVGTLGRHLPQQQEGNFIPNGRLLRGVLAADSENPADLSNPLVRMAVANQPSVLAQYRPLPVYNSVIYFEFSGTSAYHSLQATLRRQITKGLTYFVTYTFSKALGTSATNENSERVDPIDTRGRSYGVLPFDRTHIFNLSYNYEVPNLARGYLKNHLTAGLLNGWQISGITTFQSGVPIRLQFGGDIGLGSTALAFFGSDAFSGSANSSGAIAPVFLKNPMLDQGHNLGDRVLDLSAIAIPGFATSGPSVPPYYLRSPNRSNFDVSFFKNFRFTDTTKLQLRAGFFNIFNQAYPIFLQGDAVNSDINTTLNTVCVVRKDGVPNGTGGTSDNVCDPTGGFVLTDDTVQNFGKITRKHGHRIVELALKFYF